MYSPTDKQILKSMRYLQQLKDVMDAHKAKSKSIHFRKNWLERQKVTNYQNELDRIKGELAHAEMRGLTSTALEKRKETLENITRQIN